jgi:translation initiation factor 1
VNIDKKQGGLVYSTDGGEMCPSCRQPIGRCVCKKTSSSAAGDAVVRVSRESKGRGGKNVTVIKGLSLSATELLLLSRQLKTACGSGGTVKDGVIEVQGDHCDRVVEELKGQGWTVKRVGG